MAVPERVAERKSERDHDRDQDEEQPVQRPLEGRARVAERSGFAGDARRVAVGPDRGDRVGAGALDRERAGADLVAGGVVDKARLAGEDRFVEPKRLRAFERAVGHDLVAGCEADEVAEHELVDVNRPRSAVAHGRGDRRDEGREMVECPFGANLLPASDPGVGDQHAEEERVLPFAECQRHGSRDGENQVEQREDVRAHDAQVGAAAARGGLGLAFGEPPGGLDPGESGVHLKLAGRAVR